MCRWPRKNGRPQNLKHVDPHALQNVKIRAHHGPMGAQAWAQHGPIMCPWGAQTWALMGPWGGPSKGPSWAHGGFAALLINIASDYRFAYVI
jgi:hypothetical protein